VIKEQLRSQVKSCERRRDVVPWSDASDSLMEKKPYHEWDELYASPDVRELFRYKKRAGRQRPVRQIDARNLTALSREGKGWRRNILRVRHRFQLVEHALPLRNRALAAPRSQLHDRHTAGRTCDPKRLA
jgi:hypothetical protein